MFNSISTKLMQHLLAQNAWAAPMLKPHAGQSVQLNFVLFKIAFVILENGSLASAGETNVADAIITIPPSLLPRLIAKDESAKLQIQIEGDTHLATSLAKVFAELRWDYEDDFSKVIGDVPAHKIGEFARNTASTVKQTGINMAEMLSEYWQEEKPMLAKKRHIEQFNTDVDTLRADTERLEKRLNKSLEKLSKTTSGSTDTTNLEKS